jgi:DNA-binding response OmpR family regulator
MNSNGRDFRRLAGSFTRANTVFSVLYVDPDLALAEQLASVLGGRGAVTVVPSANAARVAMRGRMPTLVVMELDLPDASGVELLATLRQAPATRNVLLMVITARRGIYDKIAAFQAGADDFLVKPVDPQQFEMHVQLLSTFRQIFPS